MHVIWVVLYSTGTSLNFKVATPILPSDSVSNVVPTFVRLRVSNDDPFTCHCTPLAASVDDCTQVNVAFPPGVDTYCLGNKLRLLPKMYAINIKLMATAS